MNNSTNEKRQPADAASPLAGLEHAWRERAAEKARSTFAKSIEEIEDFSPEKIRQMLYDLRVHQIELELQNEELRRTQEELDAARDLYFDLYDLAPVGYVTVNEKGLILQANLTATRLLGVARSELVKQPLTRFILKQDQDSYYFRRKQLIETGEPQLFELRMMKQDARAFWALLESNVAQNVNGASIYRVTISDITESKRAEEEAQRLRSQLLQAQKMEVVGQLAGGIAHDFNNILAAIIMQLDLLRLRPNVTRDILSEAINELLTSANRAANLTRQLLLFSGRQPMKLSRNDINLIVLDLTKLLERLIGEQITLAVDLCDDELWIDCDAGMIGQVLTNLCTNARDAMPKGGRVTVTTRLVVPDDETINRHSVAQPGFYVCLSVSDTGSGMESSVLEHVFEPFFTTKLKDKGTGLGLATIDGIVAKHGGFVEVESQLGKGSIFSVYLPRVAYSVDTAEHDDESKNLRGGNESILFVEDERALRRIIADCLRELGYRVTEAVNGVEALQIWERESGGFDLLFTDMVMPGGISGLDLYSRIREKKANLMTIISSGYNIELLDIKNVAAQEVTLLNKPYNIATLATTIRSLLDKKS